MNRRSILPSFVAGLAIVVLAGAMHAQGAQGQQPQGAAQQQQHQTMMTMMRETVQRMDRLQVRAQQLVKSAQQQIQNKATVTERERLMLRTTEAFDAQIGHMKTLAERAEEMIRSREFQRDRDMQQDMDQLRQRLGTMANELEESLKLMERVRQRTVKKDPG